jgi:hypothetical protein
LSNEDGIISDIEYCSPLGKSDHSLIYFNFNCYIQHENTERVKYYYDKADFAGMKQELSTIDWEEKLSIQDENKQWKSFNVFKIQFYAFKISTHLNVSQVQLLIGKVKLTLT